MALTTNPPYFTLADAVAFIGLQTMQAIVNDENIGGNKIDVPTFNRLANLACTRVDGFLKRVYPGPFPIVQTPIPANIQTAALLWFKAMAYERHAEYTRQYGSGPRKEAMEFCEDLTDSKEWLADLVVGAPPANAGGIVTNNDPRVMVDGADGRRNSGDF